MKIEQKLELHYSDKLLEIAMQAQEYTQSDLQGAIQAQVHNLIKEVLSAQEWYKILNNK